MSNAAVNPMNSGQPGTIHVSVIYKLKFIFKDLPAPFSTLQTPESVWDKVRSLRMQSFLSLFKFFKECVEVLQNKKYT